MWSTCESPHVEFALNAIRLYIVMNCKIKVSMNYNKSVALKVGSHVQVSILRISVHFLFIELYNKI